ncbi:hypothetical protein V8C34DRAFT_297791 [Trichoderma compactum]
MKWPEEDSQPRRAAVCSYGYGGTVSHAIVEQSVGAAGTASIVEPDAERALFTASVPQEKRLAQQARAVAEWLSSPAAKATDLKAVANTLAQRRAHHDHRIAFVADSHEAAAACLQAAASGKVATGHHVAKGNVLGATGDPARKAVWVFSGHGAQWKDMGKELLLNTVFRQTKPFYRKVETGPIGAGALPNEKVPNAKVPDERTSDKVSDGKQYAGEKDDGEKHILLGQRNVVPGTNIFHYTTELSDEIKPFPGAHPLDGTEMIPAAV